MLSILIPIYNFDCRDLVRDLVAQADVLEEAVEIICLDDASSSVFRVLNQEILSYSSMVTYQYLSKNIGRSKIRNRLAKLAQFPYLLFMDCDAAVPCDDYLKQYLIHCQPNTVLCGGRVYQNTAPENDDYLLHWTVGKVREEIDAKVRQQQPYYSFMTNNFIAPKSVFDRLQFEEKLTQYGHEDTLFGLALEEQNISVNHLDNPLIHVGLEETMIFLEKTEQALENLVYLVQNGYLIETRLLQLFRRLERARLLSVFLRSFRWARPRLIQRLKSAAPSLFAFDLYKLGIFVEKYVDSR
ncbi:MAG: glycosyltransferase family 2 protein [Bacteroidota bacterium]